MSVLQTIIDVVPWPRAWMVVVWVLCTVGVHFVLTITDPVPGWSIIMSGVAALIYAIPIVLAVSFGKWVWRRFGSAADG